MARVSTKHLTDVKAYRISRRENQSDFWARFGVTQSGGSRYENERTIPRSTAMLLHLYATGVIDDKQLKDAQAVVLKAR